MLVGAPTGILAQPAATTRNFDISEEFEIVDDLDNKPDDAVLESVSVSLDSRFYSASVKNLVKQLHTRPRSLGVFAETPSIISTRTLPAKILPIDLQVDPRQSNAKKCMTIVVLPRSGIDPLSAFVA